MAKRKNPSLDDFVLNYLNENGMEKSYKMLQERNTVDRADNPSLSKTSKKFQDFLRSEERLTPKTEPDDLGFEINFDIVQTEAKYPVETKVGPLTEKSKSENTKRTRQKAEKKIPKGLFQRIHFSFVLNYLLIISVFFLFIISNFETK